MQAFKQECGEKQTLLYVSSSSMNCKQVRFRVSMVLAAKTRSSKSCLKLEISPEISKSLMKSWNLLRNLEISVKSWNLLRNLEIPLEISEILKSEWNLWDFEISYAILFRCGPLGLIHDARCETHDARCKMWDARRKNGRQTGKWKFIPYRALVSRSQTQPSWSFYRRERLGLAKTV